jgi:invasion protein IalB
MKRKILTLLATGALLAGTSASLSATQENTTFPDTLSEVYGSWTLSCSAEEAGCRIFQALYRAGDKARLIQVALLASAGDGDGLVLRAVTPLGAKLARGAVLIIDDGEPVSVPFDTCRQSGCLAETHLTPELVAALRAELTLAVLVVGADTDQTVRFELSLGGVSRALDRLSGM